MNIIFDLDDTLIETQPLYSRKLAEWADLMEGQGFDRAEALKHLETVDIARIKKLGFSRERWPGSMEMAYRDLCVMWSDRPSEQVCAQARAIGESVFAEVPPLIEGAKEMLSQLRRYHTLYMLTSGDESVQQEKVDAHDLRGFFEAIWTAEHGKLKAMLEMMAFYGLQVDETWIVGNSPRSDINPALSIYLRCILVEGRTWAHDEEPITGEVFCVKHLAEIPPIFEGLV